MRKRDLKYCIDCGKALVIGAVRQRSFGLSLTRIPGPLRKRCPTCQQRYRAKRRRREYTRIAL